MVSLKPIGPVNEPVSGKLEDFPPIVLGGATFSQQYNFDPKIIDVPLVIKEAFDLGINAIDTSPYYGVSEIVIGQALELLSGEYPRPNYFLTTKVGRIAADEFDYSPGWVVESVYRSLQRLHTEYLDLVYLHDIEFKTENEIFEALKQLRKLKDKGIIHNFGISGYPVDFLLKISCKVVDMPKIGKLDAVLSYCHLNVYNTTLNDYYHAFRTKAHVRLVESASILSMSLLRSAPVLPFHPGSSELKAAVRKAATMLLEEDNVELAELATRFSMREWKGKGPTVIGICSKTELELAVSQFYLKDEKEIIVQDAFLLDKFHRILGPKHINETWQSGISH